MAPRWWPYALSVDQVIKRGSVLISGVIVGGTIMNYCYSPFENLHENFNSGRVYLLRCYNQIYEERMIRKMEDRSDAAGALLKMKTNS